MLELDLLVLEVSEQGLQTVEVALDLFVLRLELTEVLVGPSIELGELADDFLVS